MIVVKFTAYPERKTMEGKAFANRQFKDEAEKSLIMAAVDKDGIEFACEYDGARVGFDGQIVPSSDGAAGVRGLYYDSTDPADIDFLPMDDWAGPDLGCTTMFYRAQGAKAWRLL